MDIACLAEEGILTVYFIDVGQADSTIIQCDEGVLMIDGGNVADSQLIFSLLRNTLGIQHIDYMIATHPHEDHVGGLAAALNACAVDILYTPVLDYDTKAFRSMMKYAHAQETAIKIPKPGDSFIVGTARVDILGPLKTYSNTNDLFVMDIDLSRHYKQSDGSMLTPFQQARRYAGLLPHNMNPRWIVISNFQEFRIHDMNNPNAEPYIVMLSDLEKEYTRLNFLVDTGSENLKREMEISIKAGELVGKLYDALLKQYKDPTNANSLKSLNALCVRLVFCLYAEDAGIFGQHLMFHDYIKAYDPRHTRSALIKLFRVLDQKPEERDPYLADDDPLLAAFPYVNSGLFADENFEIPPITEDIHKSPCPLCHRRLQYSPVRQAESDIRQRRCDDG